MSRHVTVTGAGGYVGSILVGRLLEAGYTVQALDRFFFGYDVLKTYTRHPRLRLRVQDIRSLSPADLEGEDLVIDLAALSNDPCGDLDPALTLEINESGRINLARAAKAAGVQRYVFSSSCSVYGAGDAILDESSELRPQSVYAKSAAHAEEKILRMNSSGFTSTALRLATLFGLSPRMRFDLVVNVMTLDSFVKGRITVVGGQQWRPLVSVQDAARAFQIALESPIGTVGGKVFNIGLTNLQVSDIATIIHDALPQKVEIARKPDSSDTRDYRVSFDRAKVSLGFSAEHSLEASVRDIYDAVRLGEVRDSRRSRTVLWYRHLLAQGEQLYSLPTARVYSAEDEGAREKALVGETWSSVSA